MPVRLAPARFRVQGRPGSPASHLMQSSNVVTGTTSIPSTRAASGALAWRVVIGLSLSLEGAIESAREVTFERSNVEAAILVSGNETSVRG